MDGVTICVSNATDPEVAVEEAAGMWDLDALHAIVIHPDEESGQYQIARKPEGWTNVVVCEV